MIRIVDFPFSILIRSVNSAPSRLPRAQAEHWPRTQSLSVSENRSTNEAGSRCHLFGRDRYLLIFNGQFAISSITVLDVIDGSVVDHIDGIDDLLAASGASMQQVHFDKDRITVESTTGQHVSFVWSGTGIELDGREANIAEFGREGIFYEWAGWRGRQWRRIASPRLVDFLSESTDVVITPRSEFLACSVRIVDHHTGEILHQDRLGMPTAYFWILLSGTALASVVWVMLLIHDGAHSEYRWRFLIDLGLVVAMFSVSSIPGLGELVPRESIALQPMRLLAMPAAILSCLIFLFLLRSERPLHSRRNVQ